MRVILLVACILSFSITYAQPGGGMGGGQRGGGQGGGQNGQQQERPEMREFKASEVAGIFNYDDTEALKKIKIKKNDKDLQLKVRRAIINYNNKVNEIALLNKDNFDTLNVFVNAIMKERSANRGQGQRGQGDQNDQMGGDDDRRGGTNDDAKAEREQMKELIEQKVNPARIGVRKAEKKLNTELESMLSEKQYNKWLKYQKKVKDDLNPKEETQQNNNRGGMQGGMQGGGRQGGGGGGGGMR